MHGARAVRERLLDDARFDGIVPVVAWLPMMAADDRAAAARAGGVFDGVGVTQLWDGEQLLAMEVSRSFGIEGRAAWDIYLFYEPGAEWGAAGLPRAGHVLLQSRGVVIAAKGTLPPVGDQSRAPPWARGTMDVVGEPDQLGDLLARVAMAYAGGR